MNELPAMPSMLEWTYMLYVTAGLVSCVAAGELIRKHYHWSAEITRKSVHIGVGILVFFAPMIFKSAFIPLILSSTAVILMFIAVRTGLMAGMHGTSRLSYGTVFYPFSFFLLILVFWNSHPEIVSLSMLSLATGDAAAAITGESLKSPKEFRLTSDKKSVQGSISMFIVTAVSLFVGMMIFRLQDKYSLQNLAVIALVSASIATAWEALSSKGLDNISVPISVSFVLAVYLIPSNMFEPGQFTTGLFLSLLIAAISYKIKFLTTSGAVAVFLLASTIYGLGGWKWTIPILTFFILSSALSIIGKRRKQQVEHLFDKTSNRDWGQVAANGGIAGMLIILQYIFPRTNLYPAFLGSIAAATADTWGTEIGVWFRGRTILLPGFKKVDPGTNGGISLAGFIGGTVGAFVISASAYTWDASVRAILIVTTSGIAGSLIDSYLGATVQSIYLCPECNKRTERRYHCNSNTSFVKGIRWITNDLVNLACVLTGALVSFVLY
ncbi:MAG: DUF92 domain-containing protein [Bacteroidetes bacterium]|nr:DUF92 domain-containing protein [Bacteroidota bacterium]